MYIDDIFQLNIFLYSVGFGFLLALIYDILNVFTFKIFKSDKGLFIKDFSYVIICAYLIFLFVLAVNNGKLRVYLFLGLALGFICWFMSLSALFVRYFICLNRKLSAILVFISSIITLPFRCIFSLLLTKAQKINAFNIKNFENTKNKLRILLKKK